MTYDDAPPSVRSLEQRLRNVEENDALTQRRRVAMALAVVGQLLPEGAIKGGSAMALRYGRGTRFTRDLDAARVQPPARFRSDFEESLATGWVGFTGRLIEKPAPRLPGVPGAYVMQPFDVKLDYRGRPWCTVTFELGHNEIGDADEPELRLATDLASLFTEVGLEAPRPVPVMRADHPVAQKLHAVSAKAAKGRATWSTSNSSTRARASTPLNSPRRACDSSTTANNRHGHPASSSVSSGTRCMRRPPKVSTYCQPLKRPSLGPTPSSKGSQWQGPRFPLCRSPSPGPPTAAWNRA